MERAAMNKLRVLDLFSGIGGFSLGLDRAGGFETVAFCEIEPFPRKVLAKHWPEVFCHDDVQTLTKETLCKGYAENALLNQLCKETGGNLASVKSAIETIKGSLGKETRLSTTSGQQSVERALSIITAESALAAERPSTLFWQSITSIMTETKSEKNTKELHGKSLSSADFLTITKFFVTTATWQKPYTVPAHIKRLMKETSHDVTKLTGDILARDGIAVDVITGGFPCQDISVAGKQAGISEGTRSGLWSEIVRLIGELSPRYVIVENVANLLSGPSDKRGGWFGRILGDLAECGYDAEWENIPAASVGAPHRRERVWIVAYRGREGFHQRRGSDWSSEQGGQPRGNERHGISCGVKKEGKDLRGAPQDVADANDAGLQGTKRQGGTGEEGQSIGYAIQRAAQSRGQWEPEPSVGRVANGVPSRVDRLKGLGNAVVPQIPELIGRAIMEAEGMA